MKRGELIALKVLQGWSIILGVIVIFSIGYATFQVLTGNVHGTASFEF